jgi:hypothetical protein
MNPNQPKRKDVRSARKLSREDYIRFFHQLNAIQQRKSAWKPSRENYIRGIAYLSESLTVAAAHFINAKASASCGDWAGAKEALESGFSECGVDKSGSDGIFERLAELERQSKSQQHGGEK